MSHHYKLKCRICNTELEDDGFILDCPIEHEPALLTTRYTTRQFEPLTPAEDMLRYRNWLPCQSNLRGGGRTGTYRSEGLSQIIRLPNLWIAFNGYWPERGATLETTTFKELEAYTVLARLPERPDRVLVVASAGNTAAAFAHACSQNRIPCLIVVPGKGIEKMVFSQPLDPYVKVVSLSGRRDYSDAISLAERVSRREGFFFEGGVKNVGRRDGIGTTMLNAVEAIGRLPDYYFQAVGSGTGGIAAHEAAKRLIGDGRFGRELPRLMLSQNFPFVPMYHSWKSGRQKLIETDPELGKEQIRQIVADVLSNQRPPYAIKGGVYEVLHESQGDMLVVDNSETRYTIDLFEAAEGVDIDPAAGVAVASLIKAVRSGQIDREALVLLHITGGGRHKLGLQKKLFTIEPILDIAESEMLTEETVDRVVRLF